MTLINNTILFVIFASVAYYLDMPWITILGFGFWLGLLLLVDVDDNDRRNEMIEKINFLLRGDADYVKEANEKIEKLEQEIQHL